MTRPIVFVSLAWLLLALFLKVAHAGELKPCEVFAVEHPDFRFSKLLAAERNLRYMLASGMLTSKERQQAENEIDAIGQTIRELRERGIRAP
jgi:hypothetical protein